MAPSAEKVSPKPARQASSTTTTTSIASSSWPVVPKPPLDRKTVAFAVNYEPSMVDRYWHTTSYTPNPKNVKLVPGATTGAGTNPNLGGTTDPSEDEQEVEVDDPSAFFDEPPTSSSSNFHHSHHLRHPHHQRTPSQVENVPPEENDNNNNNTSCTSASTGKGSRRSAREQKKKSVNMTSIRVRYDMELVPMVERMPNFWASVQRQLPPPTVPPPPKATTATATATTTKPPLRTAPPRVSKKRSIPTTSTASTSTGTSTSTSAPPTVTAPTPTTTTTTTHTSSSSSAITDLVCSSNQTNTKATAMMLMTNTEDNQAPPLVADCASTAIATNTNSTEPAPFMNSVVWVPTKRKDWEDSVSELTAVCTSAALRRFNPATAKKPFLPPLSREYIRDRIDIDDPLRGYQIRHKQGGWLQGFLLWTNFTTWTHYFTWDSLHHHSGMKESIHPMKDADGSLGKELESLPRQGDPSDSGIVFDNIAEIALLGGLGCGELLLRMALQDIRQHGKHQYVVLQATDGSRTFYERFGFRRVGAVCRYGSHVTNKGMQSHSLAIPTLETPIQGYRHWTHANEAQTSLDLHGGPSYMMCLKLEEDNNTNSGGGGEDALLLERMQAYTVLEKPTIEPLGAASTPALKRKVKNGSKVLESPPPVLPSLITSSTTTTTTTATNTNTNTMNDHGLTPNALSALAAPSSSSTRPKRMYNELDPVPHPHAHPHTNTSIMVSSKRRKVQPHQQQQQQQQQQQYVQQQHQHQHQHQLYDQQHQHDKTLYSPPPTGQALSYAQKQYQSVWLAVPAQEKTTSRRPPKTRNTQSNSNLHSNSNNNNVTWTAPVASSLSSSTVTSKKPKSKSASKKSSSAAAAAAAAATSPPPEHNQVKPSNQVQRIDKATLCKQKVKSYPRDRPHFYNKVVQPVVMDGTAGHNGGPDGGPYYFVLHYSEPKQEITICPMTPKGILSGKRQGRPRFQCFLNDTSKNWITASTSDYEAIPAFMVMKTPIVAQEAWDVLGDP